MRAWRRWTRTRRRCEREGASWLAVIEPILSLNRARSEAAAHTRALNLFLHLSMASTGPRNVGTEAAGPRNVELDRLVDKAMTFSIAGRSALSCTYYRRAADEARRNGETLISARLSLHQAMQTRLQGTAVSPTAPVTTDYCATLCAEVWTFLSAVLPFLIQRMDDDSLLPGRCTPAEEDFGRQYEALKHAKLAGPTTPPFTARHAELAARAVGCAFFAAPYFAYSWLTPLFADASVLFAAYESLFCLFQPAGMEMRSARAAQAFVLRAVGLMLPASRLLPNVAGTHLPEERLLAHALNTQVLVPPFDRFQAALNKQWTSREMVAMRIQRGLFDVERQYCAFQKMGEGDSRG